MKITARNLALAATLFGAGTGTGVTINNLAQPVKVETIKAKVTDDLAAKDPTLVSTKVGSELIRIPASDIESAIVFKDDYLRDEDNLKWSNLDVLLFLKSGKVDQYGLRVFVPKVVILEEAECWKK